MAAVAVVLVNSNKLNAGKYMINRGGERLLQHYRAGLNAVPLFEGYRYNPDDFFLLQVAMGAYLGQMTNIDESGAPSMGFHSYPFVLKHDPHSGDYGLGFFGHSLEASSYLVLHSQFGWLCFACNLGPAPNPATPLAVVSFAMVDSYRIRTFIEPLGLDLVMQAGNLQQITLDLGNQTPAITFSPALAAPACKGGKHAARPYSFIRLVATKTTTTRPGAAFSLFDGTTGQPCPIVRGAFQVTPTADDKAPTLAILSWRL